MYSTMTFIGMIDLWQNRYRDARRGIPVANVQQSDEFVEKRSELEIEFRALETLSEMFLGLVSGIDRGQSAIEQAAATSLCFFSRLFGVPTVNDLPPPFGARLSEALRDSFYLGMASHFVLTNHQRRAQVGELDLDILYNTFLVESISAELKMSAYNRSSNNIPRDVFTVQYETIETIVKDGLGVGFWKRGKVRSNYYNVFCSGILLPMIAEVEASKM